ncbi:hypothetical protein [Corynebacterium crudilactis]|uniref:Uncharacterized protein n=1 Tax=Corynebacterium crudilactis TaxID=1652495 RepID=A0A172QTF7_9CORY|nr:hypothetical protein [Corynebacterium crudilactis]ANE03956.1 hypothetical protein ccrud_06850 [Corynebacterium crudilactis]
MENHSKRAARKNYLAQLFLALFLASLVVGWMFALGTPDLGATAVSIFVGISFLVAALACILTSKAHVWILALLGSAGIVLLLTGIYMSVMQPEGILTAYLIPLGWGLLLGETAIAIERYWRRRHA